MKIKLSDFFVLLYLRKSSETQRSDPSEIQRFTKYKKNRYASYHAALPRFEEKVNEMFMQGKIHAQHIWASAKRPIMPRSVAALREDDWMITTHRGHGHFLGKRRFAGIVNGELFASKKELLQVRRFNASDRS
jgi:TPP-dependent pyruvate/acetoin dehydrogenase alpha subunit